jgi:hypothetical protein
MVADELRRQADQFIELAEIAPEFTRRLSDRPPRAPFRQTEPAPPSDPTADAG